MEAHSSYIVPYLGMVIIAFSVIVWSVVTAFRELREEE